MDEKKNTEKIVELEYSFTKNSKLFPDKWTETAVFGSVDP